MPLFPLTTRSFHKTTAGQRLQAWDLDLMPGPKPAKFESHYHDCQVLESLSRQIQTWIEHEEMDCSSSCTSADGAEPSLVEPIQQLWQARGTLDSYPSSIRLTGYAGALREFKQCRAHKDTDPAVFMHAFREHCLSETFLKAQANAQRRERKAHRSRVEWVNELFQEYACLQVVHLAFASTPKVDFRGEAFDTLHSQCQMLVNRLRKKKESICIGLVGYLWRIFYHPQCGPRLSLVLLLDPAHCDENSNDIATAVAQHWIEEITNREGIALTRSSACQRRTQEEDSGQAARPNSQVGKVHRDNATEVARLQSLLNYVATLDHFGDYAPSSKTGEKRRRPRSQDRGSGPWRRKAAPRSTIAEEKGDSIES